MIMESFAKYCEEDSNTQLPCLQEWKVMDSNCSEEDSHQVLRKIP